MLNKHFAKPPKRLTAQQWAEQQLAEGNVYAFDYTPEQLEMMKKAGKAPTFYNPKKFSKNGTGFTPLEGVTETDPNIVWGGKQTQQVTKQTEPKPMPVEGRKPMEFGPYQNLDPNTGKYYDPTSGQEIQPIVEGKKKGGLVKKYDLGGMVQMGAETQKLTSGLAGPLSAVGTTAATAIQANNLPNEQGEVDENKAALAGGLKWASTAAPIAANPALLAATGGLSALAIPVAGGIGAIVAARKAGQGNDEAVKQFKEKQIEEAKAKSKSSMDNAIRQRDLGYSKGGKIVGKGTGTSDGITAKVREGSFIVPAKNAEVAEELREKVLRKAPSKKAALKQSGGVDVKLSNGEHMFTPEEVNELKAQGIDIESLAPEARHELAEQMKCGGSVKGYGGGGEVSGDGVPYDKVKGALLNKADSTAFAKGYTFGDANPNAPLSPSGIGTNNKYNLGVIQSQEDRVERVISENDKFLAEIEKQKQQELYKKQSKPILTNQQVIDLASPVQSSKSNWEGGEEEMAKRKAAYDALNKYDKERVDKMTQYLSQQNMAKGGRVAPPKGYAKGRTVTGDDDEKFINDKRKELDALKKQLDDAAAKEAKTLQEKRAAENKKIAYDAAKKRFDEAVDKFQKAKAGYSRYEKALKDPRYAGDQKGNVENLKIELEKVDKLRKDVKEKADIIQKSAPASAETAKESTTKVKPYTAGGEQVDLSRPKETKVGTEIVPPTETRPATTRSAPKRTAAPRGGVEIDPITGIEDLSLRELEGVGQPSYNEAAAKSAEEQMAAKSASAGTTPTTVGQTTGQENTQGQSSPINWQNGLTQALGYGIPAIQAGIGASALSKLGKRPIDKLDADYLASIEQAKARSLQAEKEAQYGMTAEEKFLLGQENQGLLNQARAAARNYSGGSGATAFQQERMGINDAFGRGLLTKVRDSALKLQKQGIAADRAAYTDQLIAGKTDMNRRLFADQLAAWQQNQQAAGNLTAQGLTNLVSQNRYNQFLQNRDAYQ